MKRKRKILLGAAGILSAAALTSLIVLSILSNLGNKELVYAGTSTAATTNSLHCLPFSHQRNMFYAADLFWIFFCNGSKYFYYTSSFDGANFSDPTRLPSTLCGISLVYAEDFSVWYNSTYIYFVNCVDDNGLNFTMGTPCKNGTIAWMETSIVYTAIRNIYLMRPFICTDASGYLWIGYILSTDSGTSNYPHVTKSQWNNGTWSNATGFPFKVIDIADYNWNITLNPLKNNHVTVVCWSRSGSVRVRTWFSNDSWSTEQDTNNAVGFTMYCCSVTDGSSRVHIAFSNFSDYYLVHTIYDPYTNTLTREINITETPFNLGISLTLSSNTLDDSIYCFWLGNPTLNHVYCKRWNGEKWGTEATDCTNETGITTNAIITSFYQSYSGKIGISWLIGTSAPYQIRFGLIDTPM